MAAVLDVEVVDEGRHAAVWARYVVQKLSEEEAAFLGLACAEAGAARRASTGEAYQGLKRLLRTEKWAAARLRDAREGPAGEARLWTFRRFPISLHAEDPMVALAREALGSAWDAKPR